MRKFIFLLVVIAFVPGTVVHAQFGPGDAAIFEFLGLTGIDQIAYYAQALGQLKATVTNAITTAENMVKQVEATVKNLRSAKDIKSFKDFMEWNNRALYLEKQTIDTFNNMNVRIGKKDYKFTDIKGMGEGFKETYIDYWNDEFTEDQRREMWINLGMTPANYAYVQTWKGTLQNWRDQGFASVTIQGIEYENAMHRNNEIQNALAEDKDKPEAEQMGDKEIQMTQLEMQLETNKVLHDIAMYQAYMMQRQAALDYLADTPVDEPVVSDSFDTVYFVPLK